jgi:hypothetical protein
VPDASARVSILDNLILLYTKIVIMLRKIMVDVHGKLLQALVRTIILGFGSRRDP